MLDLSSLDNATGTSFCQALPCALYGIVETFKASLHLKVLQVVLLQNSKGICHLELNHRVGD